MNAASLALAERSLIATSRGRPGRRRRVRAARSSRWCTTPTSTSTSPPGRCTRRRLASPSERAITSRPASTLTAAHRLRPILTWGFPTISVQTRLELARVHVGLSDVAGARTLLAEVDEILDAPAGPRHADHAGGRAPHARRVGALGALTGSLDPDGRRAPPPHVPAHAPVVPRDRRAPVRLAEHGQDPGDLDLPQARGLRALGRRPGGSRPPTARTVDPRATHPSAFIRSGRCPRPPSGGAMRRRPRRDDGHGQARGRAPMHGARRRTVRQGRPGDAAHQRRRLGSGPEDACPRPARGADRARRLPVVVPVERRRRRSRRARRSTRSSAC